MPKQRDSALLKDILLAAMEAISFVDGISENKFKTDSLRQSAVIRKLEIMGEAAKRISEDFKKKYGKIPWKEMMGMRDRLIHGYDDIDLSIVWRVVQNELPNIIRELEPLV